MKFLMGSIDVKSTNGVYRFYQYNDGNNMPQIELHRIEDGNEVSISNVLGKVRKLNDEFGFRIEYAPKNRKHPLNTREFTDKFLNEYLELRKV